MSALLKQLSLSKFKILSGSWLKLIAVVSMLIDHAAYILCSESEIMLTPIFSLGGRSITAYYLLRKIGRIAFPIFCFLITEGYAHTGSKRKYGLSLLIFAFLSEIPFNLMVGGSVLLPENQNVFFTLFLGLLFLHVYDNFHGEIKKTVGFLAIAAAAILLKADYGLPGALLVLLLYALREQKALRAILSYPLLSGGIAAFAAFVPISMYNGKRGFVRSRIWKYGFYLFYPVHILLLLLVKEALHFG